MLLIQHRVAGLAVADEVHSHPLLPFCFRLASQRRVATADLGVGFDAYRGAAAPLPCRGCQAKHLEGLYQPAEVSKTFQNYHELLQNQICKDSPHGAL